MPQLYYTGSTTFEAAQPDPSKSIGGHISSSPVQNDADSNIFGVLSKYTIWQSKGIEYRVIALHNDTAATLTNLKMWIEWNSSDDSDSDAFDTQMCAIGLGYQSPTADDCARPLVEKLSSVYSKPFNVNLVETAVSSGTAISLPNLEADMYLGIFLSRRVLPAAKEPLSNDTLVSIMNGEIQPQTQENFVLVLDWN